VPPLYYLLLGGVERVFGISEAAVRWPSVLASGATACALFLLARRRLGAFAAWFASALFLLSDVNLRYAREARPYALTSFLCVVSFAFFFRAIERPSRLAWLGVALTNALMLFTHYAAVFAVATQGLALIWPWRGWGNARRFVAFHVPVALAFLAWLFPILAAGQYHKMEWLPAPNLGQVLNVLGWFTGGHRAVARFLVFVAVATAALVHAGKSGRDVRWDAVPTLVLWGLAPILLAFVSSYLVPSFHARYVLYATSGMILLWSVAVQALPPGRGRILVAALVCAWTAFGLGRDVRRHEADWRAAAEWAHGRSPAGPGAACRIVLMPSWEAHTLAYYYDPAAFRDPTRTLQRLALRGVCSLNDPKELASLDLTGASEVLLVVSKPVEPSRAARALVLEGFTSVERRVFVGITTSRFAHAPSALR
jgi:4-amino-4-deoxy-L-arabinose transferase-like glycosyltransferase